ncbi:MAG: hypothetical protein ACPG7F_13660, partial [Aggregatilineales bacterium]
MTTHTLHHETQHLKTFWLRQTMLEGAFVGFLTYNAILVGGFLLTRFLPVESLINDVMSLSGVIFTWGMMAGFVMMPVGAIIGAGCGWLYATLLETLSQCETTPLMNAGVYQKFAQGILVIVAMMVFIISLIVLHQADGSRFGFTLQTIGYALLSMMPIMGIIVWRLH